MNSYGVGKSDLGRQRDSNEDQFLADDELGLYVVCDGVGGQAAGEVAAAIAIQSILSYVKGQKQLLDSVRRALSDTGELVSVAHRAVLKACKDVYRAAGSDPKHFGMGCTVTLLLAANAKAAMAHVGDTRLYLCRDSRIHPLSTDHTLAAGLAKSGIIPPEAVREHRYRHVLTRVVGTQESVEVDTLLLGLLPGDRFLLCTDGLSDYLTDDDWLVLQMSKPSIETVPPALVDFANAQGGKDNITALLVQIETDAEEEPGVVELSDMVRGSLETMGAIFLFEGLTLAQLARVLDVGRILDCGLDEVVVREGELCSSFFLVLDGRFKLSREGSRPAELVTGDFLGETMLLQARPCRSTLIAEGKSRLLVLDQEPFMALLRSRAGFGVSILERLARYLSLELAGTTADFAAKGHLTGLEQAEGRILF
jgi:serine/threonine protein phosphatase PrpC/CRP-like cAMP-binding protein